LTCFLKGAVQTSREDVGAPELVSRYLALYPKCEHLTRPLEWEREKRTLDIVRVDKRCGCHCILE
jgi:hypothetical protein